MPKRTANKTLPTNTIAKPMGAGSKPPSVTAISQAYSGPIPNANELSSYENTLPGAADRIISMAEKEQANRFKNDDAQIIFNNKALDSDVFCYKWGTVIVLAALVIILASSILIVVFANAPWWYLLIHNILGGGGLGYIVYDRKKVHGSK